MNIIPRETAEPEVGEWVATDSLSSNTASGAIDWRIVKDLMNMAGEDAHEMFCDLIEVYLEDAPQRLDAIRSAIGESNASALQHSCHALRSMSVTIGAIRLGKLCEVLELNAKAQNLQDATRLGFQIDQEFLNVKSTLSSKTPQNWGIEGLQDLEQTQKATCVYRSHEWDF